VLSKDYKLSCEWRDYAIRTTLRHCEAPLKCSENLFSLSLLHPLSNLPALSLQ
jgi:hypothetical protein